MMKVAAAERPETNIANDISRDNASQTADRAAIYTAGYRSQSIGSNDDKASAAAAAAAGAASPSYSCRMRWIACHEMSLSCQL